MRTHRQPALIAAPLLCILAVACLTGLRESSAAEEEVVDLSIDSMRIETRTGCRRQDVVIPRMARELHGRRVRIRGAMAQSVSTTGLTGFQFYPETAHRAWSWGASPKPLHTIVLATLPKGQTVDYLARPMVVEGVFEVRVVEFLGEVLFVYRLRDVRIVRRNVRLEGRPTVMVGC